mmetsp:Transcript_87710/g.248494  ORF Transcript_87710/g.248494 Transcript_87710/m.248494 type:complete len:215 (+) Transcript_87710:484-1128(+)
MLQQVPDTGPGAHVPLHQVAVHGAADRPRGTHLRAHGPDRAGVAQQRLHGLARLQVPEPDAAVLGTTEHLATAPVNGHAAHRPRVALERLNALPLFEVPDPQIAVVRGAEDPAGIPLHGDAAHSTRVALELAEPDGVPDVPVGQRVVKAAAHGVATLRPAPPVHVDGQNCLLMANKDALTLTFLEVPEPQGLVAGAAEHGGAAPREHLWPRFLK